MKTTLGCCLGRQPCAAGMAEAGLPVSKVMPASLVCELLKRYCREGRRALCVQGALLTLYLCASNCQRHAPYSHSSGLKCSQALVVCYTGSEFEHCQVLESWRDPNLTGPSPPPVQQCTLGCDVKWPFINLPLLSLACGVYFSVLSLELELLITSK